MREGASGARGEGSEGVREGEGARGRACKRGRVRGREREGARVCEREGGGGRGREIVREGEGERVCEREREGARACAGGGEGGFVVHGWGARRCVREGLSECKRDGEGRRCVRRRRSVLAQVERECVRR